MNKLQKAIAQLKGEKLARTFAIQRDSIDAEKRTVELAFSSETPYERWFGLEILGHRSEEVDLSRMNASAPLLMGHDHDNQIGVIESARIDADGVGRAIVRFSQSSKGQEILQDVIDGIRTQVSVGYFVNDMQLTQENKDGADEYRVTRWTPFEASLVSVAADPTVGVGRQLNIQANLTQEENKMAEALKEKQAKAPVDLKSERQAAVDNERKRAADIQALGESFGFESLAQKGIHEGWSFEQTTQAMMEARGETAVVAESPEIGLSDKEKRSYSMVKAINALANPQDANLQKAAAFELECSATACDQLRRESKGFFVPADILQRDLNVATPASGGDLVATDLLSGSFIEKLENALAISQIGATKLSGLNGNVAIPRQTHGSSHFWLAENGASTESSAKFDQIALTPKTVGAHTEISRKLLQQSSIGIEAFIQNELALRLALGIDDAALHGSGKKEEPLGLIKMAGIGSVKGGTNGAAPTWAHIVQLESAVANANAAIGSLGYMTNTRVRGKLKEVEKFAGGGREIWGSGNTPLNEYKTVVSNQIPSNLTKGTAKNASAILFGNWADLIIGLWGGLDIQVNPYSLDTSGAVRVTAFQDVDVKVRHPESFAAMLDVLTD